MAVLPKSGIVALGSGIVLDVASQCAVYSRVIPIDCTGLLSDFITDAKSELPELAMKFEHSSHLGFTER